MHDPYTPGPYHASVPRSPAAETFHCPHCYEDQPAPIVGLCPRCAAQQRNQLWLAAGGAVAAMGVVAVIGILAVPSTPSATAEPSVATPTEVDDPAEPDPGLETDAIASCDAGKIARIVQAYNEDDRFAASVRAGEAYQRACKRSSGLDWKLLYAHEQLEHWQPAEAITDRLVREQPTDNDYWWWRAKDRSHTGRYHGAIADVRQSLTGADESNNGVQIDYLSKSARAVGQRCETAFALRWLANAGVDLHSGAEREFRQVYLGGKCARFDGKGKLSWAADGMRHTRQVGRLGTRRATFLVDGTLGTTLVRRSVADKLGLSRGDVIDVLTPTGLDTGATSTSTIAVGGATARDVPVAIVDELPDGIDAVVGLSFLWRFAVESDGETFTASPPETMFDADDIDTDDDDTE